MKCDTPARASVSSREPAPIQNPSATERTPGTRSEMTRSPVASSVSWCFDTSRDRSRRSPVTRPGHQTAICSRFVPRRTFAAEQTCPTKGVPPMRHITLIIAVLALAIAAPAIAGKGGNGSGGGGSSGGRRWREHRHSYRFVLRRRATSSPAPVFRTGELMNFMVTDVVRDQWLGSRLHGRRHVGRRRSRPEAVRRRTSSRAVTYGKNGTQVRRLRQLLGIAERMREHEGPTDAGPSLFSWSCDR